MPAPGLPTTAGDALNPTSGRRRRAVALLTDPPPDATRITELPIAALAPHPDNPRGTDLGDLNDLAASIRATGVLQPITVVPRATHLTAHPDHAPLLTTDVTHVILIGHRRAAAAALADQTTIPAVVRTDPAAVNADLQTMLIENVQRADLTPLQEAAAYQLLRAAGMRQPAIAQAVGVSQSHVSRRLKLLGLPQQVRDDLASRRITVDDALRAAAAPPRPPLQRQQLAPPPAVAAPPPSAAPPPGDTHRPPPATPAGPPAPPAAAVRSAGGGPASRDEACAAIATATLPRSDRLTTELARVLLHLAPPREVELAHRWLSPTDPTLAALTPEQWVSAVTSGELPGLTRAAWALLVASDELDPVTADRAMAHQARLSTAGWTDDERGV